MATPLRVKPKTAIKKAAQKQSAPKSSKRFSLPTKMSGEVLDMSGDTWMIYGPKKIGKTSLAVQFPGALLCAFEPASRSIKAYRVDCNEWPTFLDTVDALVRGDHQYKSVIIDTALEAYQICLEYASLKNGFEHPGGRDDYGASWNKVKNEFRKPFRELQAAGLNVIVVAHQKLKENETRAGQKFDSVCPALSSQADEFFKAMIGNQVYYHIRGAERFIQIRGTDYIDAGVGIDDSFLTPSGELVFAVPAGRSAGEAYDALERCFRNLQEQTFESETEKFDQEQIKKSIRKKLTAKSRRR